MNLAVRRWFPVAERCGDHHRHAVCGDQKTPIVAPNDGISRAAIVAATTFKRIPLMGTCDR
jgi:hypothetical protein